MIVINRNNTIVTIESLGEVHLKYLSSGDMAGIYELVDKKDLTDREFTQRVVYKQMVVPKIKFTEFEHISENELIILTKSFIDKEEYTFKYLKPTNNFFRDFRFAIIVYKEKLAEKITTAIGPQLEIALSAISSFNALYSSIIPKQLKIQAALADPLKVVGSLTDNYRILDQNIKKLVEPIVAQTSYAAKIIEESIKPQIEHWLKWVDSQKPIFDEYWKYLAELEKEFNITNEKALQTLKKYNWFITPSLPTSLVFEIVELDKQKGRQDKAINRLFYDYFAENNWANLDTIVSKWQDIPLFKKRIKIIFDCIAVLKIADYSRTNLTNVLLPTLIVQIDGLISDYLEIRGLSWKASYGDYFTKGGTRKRGRISVFDKNKSSTLNTEFERQANDIFLNILFQKSYKGIPLKKPFYFNRHKIIHGEYSNYGKKNYLIRAFLILDYFAHLK